LYGLIQDVLRLFGIAMSKNRRHLHLVRSTPRKRGVVTIAPHHQPPFPVQGLVLEEDTWFALSSSPKVLEPSEHPIRVMTDAWEAEPALPGSVHVRDGHPFRILAVVHDLSLDPTWRVEWIELALRRSLEVARKRGLQALGIEPLGTVHGRFPVAEFDALLDKVLQDAPVPDLDLWRIDPLR